MIKYSIRVISDIKEGIKKKHKKNWYQNRTHFYFIFFSLAAIAYQKCRFKGPPQTCSASNSGGQTQWSLCEKASRCKNHCFWTNMFLDIFITMNSPVEHMHPHMYPYNPVIKIFNMCRFISSYKCENWNVQVVYPGLYNF